VKKLLGRVVLTWWFQITWAIVCIIILIWNVSTGNPIGVLVSLLAVIAMMFSMHKHWETQIVLRKRNREIERQWTEDDL
jgi:hypothetical protein